jgi:deoxyribodipyrimidine photolyase-related protein
MFFLTGSHLFDPLLLEPFKDQTIVMIEDYEYYNYFSYHQLRIAFSIEAMRNYGDLLKSLSFKLSYHELSKSTPGKSLADYLYALIIHEKTSVVTSFSIEDIFLRKKLEDIFARLKINWIIIESPMFLNSEAVIKEALPSRRPLMKTFYQEERKRRNILMLNNKPLGGKYSFDKENRHRLPPNITIPPLPSRTKNRHTDTVIKLVQKLFAHNPGRADEAWLPVTRWEATLWFEDFLEHRLRYFGLYEDAINSYNNFIFHSVISPLLNSGLLTPLEVIEKTLDYAGKNNIPINSLEGFIRQIMGWREFIRGIYEKFSVFERESNFFRHQRKLSSSWYNGTTGLVPLDDVIKKVEKIAYCHHIERLMVISNAMLLSEIAPQEVYRWFMEMFIDSADWVMTPNVFGMGQMSDGGLFTTKPYICGSHYILKMSSYKKAPWCDILDGLYWRFIEKHRDFFNAQPRMAMMPKALEGMSQQRRAFIYAQAEDFILKNTL